ncbi:hypothetical protein WOLCODRAFT_81601 [Wolfiporia cocos MD-104 SS10]|uniref:DUF6533 domain-containing protein n=1 Tax=Wolfiporia cocos (strain MD-104) TaxID=742152 RepID=A0A2H3JJH9_WOLCO|nr:hypothetical protein WOLCODRAFT_81601 [Wolfiporia cocos MD-104 SS10]
MEGQCFVAAATTWLLYDLVYSLQDEVCLSLCRSNNTLPKFLYLISRYFGLFCSHLHLHPPGALLTIQSTSALDMLSLSMEVNLMLRLYALYGQRRLKSRLICGIQAFVILNVLTYKYLLNTTRPFPSNWPIKGCYPDNAPPFSQSNCWQHAEARIALLFVMLAMKCLSYRRLRDIPILRCIWRDGTMYYIM